MECKFVDRFLYNVKGDAFFVEILQPKKRVFQEKVNFLQN